MLAAFLAAGEVVAKPWFIETTAQHGEDFANDDSAGGKGQGVTTVLAADAFHESCLTQNAKEFGDIVVGDAFELADFRNGEALPRLAACQLEQAAKSVFSKARRIVSS